MANAQPPLTNLPHTPSTLGRVDDLDDFLRRIGRVPLLTAEQERRLGRRVQRGDLAARERMVEANLRLVVHLARGLRREGSPLALADLVQEGTIGLVRAVERFDPARGFRFSTYASWWIRQAMLHALAEHRDGLRLSGPAVRRGRELRAAREELGPAATRTDLAARLGWSEDEVAALERASAGVVSLDAAGELAEAAPDTVAAGERREDVSRLLAALDARSRRGHRAALRPRRNPSAHGPRGRGTPRNVGEPRPPRRGARAAPPPRPAGRRRAERRRLRRRSRAAPTHSAPPARAGGAASATPPARALQRGPFGAGAGAALVAAPAAATSGAGARAAAVLRAVRVVLSRG